MSITEASGVSEQFVREARIEQLDELGLSEERKTRLRLEFAVENFLHGLSSGQNPFQLAKECVKLSELIEPLISGKALQQRNEEFPKELKAQMARVCEAARNLEAACTSQEIGATDRGFRREAMIAEARIFLIACA